VIILSHGQWQRQFHADPGVIGSTVRFGGGAVEIIGVMGPEFAFTEMGWSGGAVAWLPEMPNPAQRRARYRHVVGRLAPGVSVQEAQAEFDVIATRLAAEYPRANADRGVLVSKLLDVTVADARQLLWLLLGAAACVLLIGSANVANLLLAHASGRRLELATRIAVGASRAHLVRQTLTEGVVLGCGAGACGVLLAYLAIPSLVQLAPPEIPRLQEIAVNGRVFAFSFVLSVIVGAGCGLAACLSLSDLTSARVLRAGGADAAHSGRWFRQVLTVAEIALALMLVVATGLLVRTMRAVGALELGFDPTNVISVGLTYDGPEPGKFDTEFLRRVRTIPGLVAAGIGTRPLGGGMGTMLRLPAEEGRQLGLGADSVSVGYLEALGGRLTDGRFFDDRDTANAPLVAILNQSAARHFWPRETAVGKLVAMGEKRLEIVGIIADVRRADLEVEPGPVVYLPNLQATEFRANNMLIRSERDPRLLLPALRALLRQVDRQQALVRIQTLQERIEEATAPRRFVLRLVGAFSLMALGLAMIGVYAVIAESVARRVPEIGIRMALGATARNVTSMILRQGIWMLAFGVVLGLIAAAALRGVMSTFVFGVPTTDLPTYAVAGLCLALATVAACVIPAARAARVDPVIALRAE
jgi:putative ABC transport system permease protein